MRYLHFGTEWIQGAMRIRKPDHIEFEYAQQMMAWLLFLETPERIVQLGLGTAALTKFCHRFLKRAKVEAVELNPAVVIAARAMFDLPWDDARLTVTEQGAWEFVNDRRNHGSIGALQIDIYHATARGPVLDSVSFYRACRACLTSQAGVVTVNLFGDHPSFVRNMRHLNEAFDRRVIALPEVHDGNRIVAGVRGSRARHSVRCAQRTHQVHRGRTRPARAQMGQGPSAKRGRAGHRRLHYLTSTRTALSITKLFRIRRIVGESP